MITLMTRTYSPIDRILIGLDQALKGPGDSKPVASRDNPGAGLEDTSLDESQRQHVAGLMRINHTGEVCAQALYAGQAAGARTDEVREKMQKAADEEQDHLAWCAERLEELDSHPSRLDWFWYSGSYVMGLIAGFAGDKWSLGFLKETENQVEAHLEEHIGRLPETDQRSQAILEQMKIDEASHAAMAEEAGANPLPEHIRKLMKLTADTMKAIAYRI
jgi:ubiquinone biosynthesis monooxygenase Coq7